MRPHKLGETQFALFSHHTPAIIQAIVNLEGEKAAPVEGCYKGEREPAFIAELATFCARFHGECLADGQESYLILDEPEERYNLRPATLVYFDGRPSESIGYFGAAPKAYALAQDGWTLKDGEYFTTFDSVEAYVRARHNFA
jgi:hypothetical protein